MSSVVLVVDLDGDGDGNLPVDVVHNRCDVRPIAADMLSFQKLDVYQRAIEFLDLAYGYADHTGFNPL